MCCSDKISSVCRGTVIDVFSVVCVCVCVFVSPVSACGLGLAGRCMALDGAASGSNSTAVSSLFPSQVSLPSLTYLASCAIVCIFLVCHDFFGAACRRCLRRLLLFCCLVKSGE